VANLSKTLRINNIISKSVVYCRSYDKKILVCFLCLTVYNGEMAMEWWKPGITRVYLENYHSNGVCVCVCPLSLYRHLVSIRKIHVDFECKNFHEKVEKYYNKTSGWEVGKGIRLWSHLDSFERLSSTCCHLTVKLIRTLFFFLCLVVYSCVD